MIALAERGVEINPILLGDELRREGMLERVGGIVALSKLTTGIPRCSDISSYAAVIRQKSIYRRLVKLANGVMVQAQQEDDQPQNLIDELKDAIAAFEEVAYFEAVKRTPLLTSFAELMRKDFPDGDALAFHARRGELALVQSVTNHGKSTLVRNAAIALATGGECLPIVEKGQPRRVALLNFEGAGAWFRTDLSVMTRDFPESEIELVGKNFFPTHAPSFNDEPLSLSRHMRILEREVRRSDGIDVLIIDTATAAFALRNENDNAEVANSVIKPLISLARKLNCLIVLVHHVGKAKSEEGVAREHAHRGRGASTWGDLSSAIFNLDADPHDQDRVTLTCAKRKDGAKYQRVLRLNRESRFFEPTDEKPAKIDTSEDVVTKALLKIGKSPCSTAEIVEELAWCMGRSTVMKYLKLLGASGRLVSPKHGWWAVPRDCPSCLAPLEGRTNCTNCTKSDTSFNDFTLAAETPLPPNGNEIVGNGAGHGN
jgi:hypothetical protein